MSCAHAPNRVLFVRPDTYGDIVLFEPALRAARAAWPEAEVAVLVREAYADIAPLMPEGVRWLRTSAQPYRGLPVAGDPELARLRGELEEFSPDLLVAPCFDRTWLEWLAAMWLPDARRVCLGPNVAPLILRLVLEKAGFPLPADAALYPEVVLVPSELPEVEKTLRLAAHLTGRNLPTADATPRLQVPAAARDEAREILARLGLEPGSFVACAPAGVANVPIKAWPAARFGETVRWLETAHGVRTLLVGHRSEEAILESVALAAGEAGATPARWSGANGGLPLLAALLGEARAYLGNDTAAMHLAAALGRPTVGVFGGGTWPRFIPRGTQRTAAAVRSLPCFGCDWQCMFDEPYCLSRLPADPVREALDRVLTEPAGGAEIVEGKPWAGLDQSEQEEISRRAARRDGERKAAQQASPNELRGLFDRLEASERDRLARLEVVESQGRRAGELESALAERTAECDALRGHLEASERDRATRLEVVEGQGRRVGELESALAERTAERDALRGHLESNERDRAARLEVVEAQGRRIGELEATLVECTAERDALRGHLEASEQDRAARLEVIEEQARRMGELGAAIAERDALRGHLEASEQDRAARLEVIEAQGRRISELEAALAERNTLRGQLEVSEQDWAARFEVIEAQGRRIGELEAALAERNTLRGQLEASERERAVEMQLLSDMATELRRQLEGGQIDLARLRRYEGAAEAHRAVRLLRAMGLWIKPLSPPPDR